MTSGELFALPISSDFSAKFLAVFVSPSVKEIDEILIKARKKLLEARSKRVRPGLDDKILTSWNALMLKGYIDAYRYLGDENYLKTAIKNAEFIKTSSVSGTGSHCENPTPPKKKIEMMTISFFILHEIVLE